MASNIGIPLHCNICPKKPNFSDVSHLLTHIASKGHLSHYYKVKVRSANEGASKGLIEAYDRWYIEWGLEELMSERMNFKDKKRPRPRTTGRVNQTPAPIHNAYPRSKSNSSAFDPRLSDLGIKSEPRTTPPLMQNPFPLHQPFVPKMQLWSSASPSSFGNPSTEYDWPNENNEIFDSGSFYTTATSISANTYAVVEENEEPSVTECTKLKGVYWPGMDIFDSATPEMRRKRNQKKDISVIEQLELNSKEVEPNELIFTPLGSFKRQRRISGSTYDESSPIKEELSPKPRRFIRPALTELDPNRQYSRHAGGRPPLSSSVFQNADDESYELKPLYGEISSSRKNCPFEIFRDQVVAYAQPTNFNYLATEFQYPQPPDMGSSRQQVKQPYIPKWRFEEKENYGSIAYQYANYYPHSLPTNVQSSAYNNSLNNQDTTTTLFANPFQTFSTFQPTEPDADDQETITAPPSEI